MKIYSFDIGNVLLNVDPARRDECVRFHGSKKTYASLPTEWPRDFRLGHMSENEYLILVSDALGISIDQVLQAERSMLGKLDQDMISIARSISSLGHRTIALSNNQPIHWQHLKNIIPFHEIFSHVYLSQDLHLAKPDRKIFDEVARIESIHPKDIVLIDDEEEIIAAAIEAGWVNSIVHKNALNTAEQLQQVLR